MQQEPFAGDCSRTVLFFLHMRRAFVSVGYWPRLKASFSTRDLWMLAEQMRACAETCSWVRFTQVSACAV